MSTIRARFDGEVLVPVDPVNLPTDRLLELDVREATIHPPGSPQAILELLHRLGPVDPAAIDEMKREIQRCSSPETPTSRRSADSPSRTGHFLAHHEQSRS